MSLVNFSEPHHIAQLTECYRPVGNGVVRSIETLCTALNDQGMHCSVVAPEFPGYVDLSPDVYRLPSVQAIPYPLTNVTAPLLIRSMLNQVPADLVHTHHPFLIGKLGINLARKRRVPLISTAHTRYDLYSHHVPLVPGEVTHTVTTRWVHWYYNQCALVIAPSEDTYTYLRSCGVTAPIEIISTGIPLPPPEFVSQSAQQAARTHWKIPAAAPILLYVGRLSREKSPEVALEAFITLARQLPSLHFVLAGEGPLQESLSVCVQEAKLTSRVHFTGWLPTSELSALYATTNLLLLPSTTETQGLVVGEALAAGTPVVVSDQGGASEFLTLQTGVRVPSTGAAFAAAALPILGDPNRQATLQTACLVAAQSNTPEKMAIRVRTVYRQAKRDYISRPSIVRSSSSAR